jgi:hypothetical protein
MLVLLPLVMRGIDPRSIFSKRWIARVKSGNEHLSVIASEAKQSILP